MGDPLRALVPRLTDLGFTKRAGGVLTIELADDVLGWLGLNRATRHRPPGEVEVNPVVGVRQQEVERVVAECRGEPLHPYQPPTVSTPLGYLLPPSRYRGWVLGGKGSEVHASEILEAIQDHGLPFMHATAPLPQLCAQLEAGLGFEQQLIYRRPAAWLVAGEPERAREALEEGLARLGDRHDPAAEELRRFADALRERLTGQV